MFNNPYFIILIILTSCAANTVKNEAVAVRVLYKTPDARKCVFVGEVSGRQGNWITGDFTSNEDLMVGARNTLKNNTYALGGNTVHIHEVSNASAYRANGNTATAITGSAYSCEEAPLSKAQKVVLERAKIKSKLINNIKQCKLGRSESCWNAAWRSAVLKNNADALQYLELAFKEGWNNWEHLANDKDIESLRKLKEYRELVSRYKD